MVIVTELKKEVIFMSLLNGIMGNVTDANHEQVAKELEPVLIEGESVNLAYKLVRDLIVFTDYRLIIVDKQGVTGKKADYKTFPYKSISRFSVETAGHFDLDAELKIWISGAPEPVQSLQFRKDKHINEIQKVLAEAILK